MADWDHFGFARIARETIQRRGTNFHVETLNALARGDGGAARATLEANIGRSFDLVMLWQSRDGAA